LSEWSPFRYEFRLSRFIIVSNAIGTCIKPESMVVGGNANASSEPRNHDRHGVCFSRCHELSQPYSPDKTMLKNRAALAAALEVKRLVGPALIDASAQAYFANLGAAACPSTDALDAAMVAARIKLHEGLFRSGFLEQLVGRSLNDSEFDALPLKFAHLAPELRSPPLPATSELYPARVATAAMLGAGLGVLVGGPIGMYLLGARDTGILVGAPIGAFVTTWAVNFASRNEAASNTLIGVLGVATVAEAWAFLSVNPLAAVWQRLSGRRAVIRVAIYVGLIALLAFTLRQSAYDKSILERSVRQSLEQWLHTAVIIVVALVETTSEAIAGAIDTEGRKADAKQCSALGRRIVELFAATTERLPGAAEDVIAAARDAGFDGLDGPAQFRVPPIQQLGRNPEAVARSEESLLTWNESMRLHYRVFGHIEIGDTVRVEQEPVLFRGEVQAIGLVRKHRGR